MGLVSKRSLRANAPLRRRAFTLIELLVVIAIISLLMGILVPALGAARRKARATRCLANLHVLGHGIAVYTIEHEDAHMPSRLPKIDDCNAYADLFGRRKYRPTVVAMMSIAVGVPPFEDPKACKTEIDMFGEDGDRQNYSYPVYVCPSVSDWTDERNGSYGYNYQFLGNSRLSDPAILDSYKNWTVRTTQIRYPGRTVALADCMGTAASWPRLARGDYINNARDADRFGNEGFNLDPPRVDAVNGEMANFDATPQSRTAADPRHAERANVLWLDGHATARTLRQLGYIVEPDGIIAFDGEAADNTRWTGNGTDVPWTPDFTQ
ncbi:MAG: prepilin-type N-terminal cleavage/methylation domain-containing protein [Planctomycetota bacterium]